MQRYYTFIRSFLLVLVLGVVGLSISTTLHAATEPPSPAASVVAAPAPVGECTPLTALFLPLVQGTGGGKPAPLGDEPPTDDEHENTSTATVFISGVDTTGFNSAVVPLTFNITCPG